MIAIDQGIAEDPGLSYRPIFLTALAVMAGLTAAGLGWGMFARLDSAVVARGFVLAESERKTVEHYEGGILDELLVKPGEHVAAGQVVARLDATQPREQLARLRAEWAGQTLDLWRLSGEEADAETLDPASAPPLEGVTPEERADLVAAQIRLFDARNRAYAAQMASLRHQVDQLTAQAEASTGQAKAAERQRALWAEERANTAHLVEKGAAPKQRLLELDRNIATLEGDRDEALGLARAAEQQISRARSDMDGLRQQRLSDIGGQRGLAARQVEGLAAQIRAALDVLNRLSLRAPQSGTVVDIRTRTRGAIIGTGKPLMDILPDTDTLVVETRVAPETIDTVHVGRPASVRLTAYPRARAPVVTGTVTYVSADRLEDERDGTAYYDLRVTLDPESLKALPDIDLVAGMPVEVAIETGERRAGEYILAPLLRRFDNALREE
jgi:HlyD family secretion protein